jgi:hypothetical protein
MISSMIKPPYILVVLKSTNNSISLFGNTVKKKERTNDQISKNKLTHTNGMMHTNEMNVIVHACQDKKGVM